MSEAVTTVEAANRTMTQLGEASGQISVNLATAAQRAEAIADFVARTR